MNDDNTTQTPASSHNTNTGNAQGTQRKNSWWITALLIAAIAVIAVFPMFFNFGDDSADEQFGGTDSAAGDIVLENDPSYSPWFEPLVGELPGEVESGLFALQASLGAGVLGYVLGYYRGKNKPHGEQR